MKAVPPDPTHLRKKKFENRQKWQQLLLAKELAISVLVSTGKPGLYLKFEISAGYL